MTTSSPHPAPGPQSRSLTPSRSRGNARDVAVVGGGFAGLQAGLTLGRACRSVVVFDGGPPRNSAATHVHNFLGLEATSPTDLLGAASRALAEHDVTVMSARAESAARDPQSGVITLHDSSGQTWSARVVVLATGYDDQLPAIEGIAALWGDTVAACPHCHGWEVRNSALAMVANPALPARSIDRALLLSRWSRRVTFLTAGIDLTHHDQQRLAGAEIQTIDANVRSVRPTQDDSIELILDDARTLTARMLYLTPTPRHHSKLAQQLGCELTVTGDPTSAVQSNHSGRTTVDNVWAAGTAAQPALLAIGAAGHASTVAIAVHQSLLDDDIDHALARETRPLAP